MADSDAPECAVPRCSGPATAYVKGAEVYIGAPTSPSQIPVCNFHLAEVLDKGRRTPFLAMHRLATSH